MKKRIFFSICLTTIGTLVLCFVLVLGVLALREGSLPHTAALLTLKTALSLWWAFLLIFALVALIAYHLARKITEPLNRIDPKQLPGRGYYPELAPLFNRLAAQNATIEKQLANARQKQEEFRVLSENMEEGILIVDRHGAVLSSNGAAQAFLALSETNDETDEVLRRALKGRHAENTLTRDGHIYRLLGSPVLQNERNAGAVLLILDETEKRSLEQFRREFTANVSHELKTPLTSISGFAELMQNGMVAEADIPDFASSIYNEAQRLLTLVNDIIRLSQIEDGILPYESGSVDLYALSLEALRHVSAAAEARGISAQIEGEPIMVHGAEPILYDVVYNLCDNAVKYNRDGGSFTVFIRREGANAVLSVSDTGIGIPSEHRDRIFERFYRVDKSHSKEIGGTGLGLSIVRHGAEYHGAVLKLESELGKGTTVTLVFPEEALADE